MLRCTVEDLNSCLRDETGMIGALPAELGAGMRVVSLDERRLVYTAKVRSARNRPTGVVSGPVLFALIDTAGWLVTIAHNWPRLEGVTTDLSVQFLRPALQGELTIEATVLRIGRRCVIDVNVDTAGDAGPAAHAVVTFAPVRR